MINKDKIVGSADREINDITEDMLNIRPTSEGLAEFIKTCDTSDTSMTIAVSGEWGSGKSSLMNMVENSLLKKKQLIRGQEEAMQVNQSLMQEIDTLLEEADEQYEYPDAESRNISLECSMRSTRHWK